MSLDETLFRWAWRFAQKFCRQPHAEKQAQTAYLAALRLHLALVARTLSGEALEVQEAENVGGFRGNILYLPQSMSVAPALSGNVQAYLYRLAYTVTSRQLGFVLTTDDAPDVQVLRTLLAVPTTLRAVETLLPMTHALRARFFPLLLEARPAWPALETTAACLEALTHVLLGRPLPPGQGTPAEKWLRHSLAVATTGEGVHAAQALWVELQSCGRRTPGVRVLPVLLWGQLLPATASAQSGPPEQPDMWSQTALPNGTELPGKPKEQVQRVQLDQRDIDQDVLLHTFDKIETAEEFQGVTRTPDGADELAQHAEALAELDLRQVVRSTVPTQSLYKTDLQLDSDIGDLADTDTTATVAYRYDEWDGKARRYKPHWCTVYVRGAPAPAPTALATVSTILHKNARIIRDLRLLLEKVRSTRVLHNRQPAGAEVDLDALVDRYATVRSGHAPDDRLYLARRRHKRDLATLILLDMSYSTDAWIQGHRVLDIARESVLVLGEVLAQWHDRVAVASFYSHTRRDCRFIVLKNFAEPWQRCKASLANLEPTGYTRIGPALRHGTALLQGQQAAKKLLLLISDGKPTDYDRYEGRYGIADVRQAIREAQQARIHTYALAVDVQAKQYVPQMFGRGNFQILPHPTHLVRSLVDLYRRLSR